MPDVDRSPLIAIARGDESAFAGLYDTLSTETYGLCRRAESARAAAEELHREIWLVVWRHATVLSAARESSRVVVLSVARAMARRSASMESFSRADGT